MNKEAENKIEKIRHSLSHVMALAVKELYPGVKFGIGPSIENGFYYDFALPAEAPEGAKAGFSPEDLPKIEKRMRELIKKGLKFEEKMLSEKEVRGIFNEQPYKLELIGELKKENPAAKFQVSSFKLHDFIDLCKGPHIGSTKEIDPKSFKLDKVAGAYWRGDEKRPMLTRIYGLAFSTGKELSSFLKQREEAEKRDHRKLGAQLDLFSFHSESPGMPFWHHKGFIIFKELVEHWRKIQKKHGYQEVRLPNVLDVDLWKQSGHYEHYKDSMFFVDNKGKEMALRPMDCPGCILLYKEDLRSYRDLPMRIGELGTVFRNEKTGELHGLMRVQHITQDDAHIFIRENQIEAEVSEVLKILEEIYQPFSLKKNIFLSTRPDDAMGDIKTWQKAEKALSQALKKNKIEYGIKEKDGAFYGPKIDVQIEDCLGRSWQAGTIQLDFFMPENFKIEYINEKGKPERPVIIHRALMGSLERFIGILLEHYAGALPLWLSPVQVKVLPIGREHRNYSQEVLKLLLEAGLRAEANLENETMGRKIRGGEVMKIPYLLVVGDKEIKSKKVAVRHSNKDLGPDSLPNFIKKVKMEIIEKK